MASFWFCFLSPVHMPLKLNYYYHFCFCLWILDPRNPEMTWKSVMLPEALLLHWRIVLRCLNLTYINRIVMIRNYTYTKNDFPKFEGWEMSTHLFLYTLNLLRHERKLLHFKVLLRAIFSFKTTQLSLMQAYSVLFKVHTYGGYLNISCESLGLLEFWPQHLCILISNIQFVSKVSQGNLQYQPIPFHCVLRTSANPQSERLRGELVRLSKTQVSEMY